MRQKEKTVTITKQEYDSMKETLEILSNPEIMRDIRDSEESRKKGNKPIKIKL